MNDNVWEYAEAEVKNPGLGTRIAHSAEARNLSKRASTTSGAAQTGLEALQAGTAAIPVPFVGSFVSAALGKIFAVAKAKRLEHNLANAVGNNEKLAKFGLKALDAKALDAKRKKVHDAYQKFKAESTGQRYQQYVAYAQRRGETCHPLVEKAKNIEYALKHIRILSEQADNMVALGGAITLWCEALETEILEEKEKASTLWAQNLKKTVNPANPQVAKNYHQRCMDIGGFCCMYKIQGGSPQPNPNLNAAFKAVRGVALSSGLGTAKGAAASAIKATY